jgi:hypothetical protein
MLRARIVLVSMVSTLSACAILASSASAKIGFEWFVNGSLLKAGESRTFSTSTNGKVFDLSGTVAGVAVLILSSQVSSDGGKISGGKPGTGEEALLFENVVVDRPAGCEVAGGKIATTLQKIEIVEAESTHEPLILIKPKTGTTFDEILFLKKGSETCVAAGASAKTEGDILATPLPSLTEALCGALDIEALTKEFLLSSGGTVEKAGLTFAGNAATLTGLVLLGLTSDEKFGAF